MNKFYLRTNKGTILIREEGIKSFQEIGLEFTLEEVMQSSFLTNLFYDNTSILLYMDYGSCNDMVNIEDTSFIQNDLGGEGIILKDNYKLLFYKAVNSQLDSIIKDIKRIEKIGKGTIKSCFLNNYSIFKQWHRDSRFKDIEWKELIYNVRHNESCWIRLAIEEIHDIIDYLNFLKIEEEKNSKNKTLDFRTLLEQNNDNISKFINSKTKELKEGSCSPKSVPKNVMWFSVALNDTANYFYLKGNRDIYQCDLIVSSFLDKYFAIPVAVLAEVLGVKNSDILDCFPNKLNRNDIDFI